MRLQLCSDLHLERDPGFFPTPVPGADVLVLAGDIGSYQPGSRLEGDDFGLARFSPRQAGARWPVVLYLPGNHEYDHHDYPATRARLQGLCEALGITWLEGCSRVIDGVRFVGSTLWTDFDALAVSEPTLAKRLVQRGKAMRAADHYLRRNTTRLGGEPLLAEGMRALALDAQAWLRGALAAPHDGPTVVVSHFAPSLRSADPRYGLSPGTAGFCNGLDDLFGQVDLWLHGHLHCPVDYRVETARRCCRVVANPLGYASKGEQRGYRPDLLIPV